MLHLPDIEIQLGKNCFAANCFSDELFPSLCGSMPVDPSKVRGRLFDQCPICLDDMISSKKLQCGHEFCRKCIDQAFKTKPVCPTCNKVFGPLKGDQPRGGRMIDTIESRTLLPGYETAPGAIVIRYTFPSGIQEVGNFPCLAVGKCLCESLALKIQSWL